MKDRQPPLYLITGIIIGLLVGVLISKVILPVRYTDVSPNTLSADQKDIYRGVIGRAYLYEGDRTRAFTRLALLGDESLGDVLVSQAQQMVAANKDTLSARGLALLASALTNPNAVITPLAAQAQVDTLTDEPSLTRTVSATKTSIPPTATPFATYTPRPTATAKPTQGAPYQLVGEPKEICNPESNIPLLIVYVYDSAGDGMGGVQIELSVADGGSSSFFTGLYPEINSGYADYEMMSGVTYSLRVGVGGDILSGLTIPQCTANDGSSYPGSLELKFKQP
jgi:hypothetical protein